MPLSAELLRRFRTEGFIETGSSLGDGISLALREDFPLIRSVELSPQLYETLWAKYQDDERVDLFQGDSATMLPAMLAGAPRPSTIWLDAHYFAGARAVRGWEDCPLLRELKVLAEEEYREHILLIDDMRLVGTQEFPEITWDGLIEAVLRVNPDYRFLLQDGAMGSERIFPDDILVAAPPLDFELRGLPVPTKVPRYPHDPSLRFLGLPVRGKTVLDVGCGNGRLSLWLERQGAQVTGLDVRDQPVRQRAYTGTSCQFLHQPISQLAEREAQWDVVFCHDLLNQLENPLGALRFLHRAARDTLYLVTEVAPELGPHCTVATSNYLGAAYHWGPEYVCGLIAKAGWLGPVELTRYHWHGHWMSLFGAQRNLQFSLPHLYADLVSGL